MKKNQELSLAFLDVLSCALGGMIILFMVFSTFNQQGQTGRPVPRKATSLEMPLSLVKVEDEAGSQSLPELWQLIIYAEGKPVQVDYQGVDLKLVVAPLEHSSLNEGGRSNLQSHLIYVAKPETSANETLEVSSENGGLFEIEFRQHQPGQKSLRSGFATKWQAIYSQNAGWVLVAKS